MCFVDDLIQVCVVKIFKLFQSFFNERNYFYLVVYLKLKVW